MLTLHRILLRLTFLHEMDGTAAGTDISALGDNLMLFKLMSVQHFLTG
jgi:hypothetical protein